MLTRLSVSQISFADLKTILISVLYTLNGGWWPFNEIKQEQKKLSPNMMKVCLLSVQRTSM